MADNVPVTPSASYTVAGDDIAGVVYQRVKINIGEDGVASSDVGATTPFPHGGGVVSLESLFMGVPIVTLYGPQPSGRTASSVLTAMGFTDWIAKSPEQYIDIAAQKSKQIKELKDIRSVLRTGLLESPVVKGYPQAVEKAYRDIWKACR